MTGSVWLGAARTATFAGIDGTRPAFRGTGSRAAAFTIRSNTSVIFMAPTRSATFQQPATTVTFTHTGRRTAAINQPRRDLDA